MLHDLELRAPIRRVGGFGSSKSANSPTYIDNAIEDCLRQVVTLEQMAEIEDRRLVGDRVEAELQTGKRTYRLNVVECFLRARIGESGPAEPNSRLLFT